MAGKEIILVDHNERTQTGNATGQEIWDFSEKIISSVKEKFRITLEREVNVL